MWWKVCTNKLALCVLFVIILGFVSPTINEVGVGYYFQPTWVFHQPKAWQSGRVLRTGPTEKIVMAIKIIICYKIH